MDDAQRVIAATLGVGLVLGAIGWVSVVTLPSSKVSWELRVLVPAAMFAVGALLVVWAWRGRSNQPCKLLAKAITDGHALTRLMSQAPMSQGLIDQWQHWETDTFNMLRQHFGLAAAQGFQGAGATGSHPAPGVAAQVAYLERLKKHGS